MVTFLRVEDRTGRIPHDDPSAVLWRAVADDLAEQIDSGELPPGTKLPGVLALQSIYGVSLPTIRSAVNHLAEQKRLNVVRGKGTFVLR